MRLSSRFFIQNSINAIIEQQVKVSDTQLRIASGKNILTPADDPVAASQVLGLNQEIARAEQLRKNIDFAENRLQLEETTLEGVDTTFFRMRELTIQAMNTTLPQQSRDSIVAELELRLDEMIGLANTKDGSGEYIFAGFNGRSQPFARDPSGNFIYTGDQGQRKIAIANSVSVAISDSGYEVFQNVKQGNGTFVAADGAGNVGTGIIDPGAVIDPTAYVVDTYTISFAALPDGSLEYSVTGAVSGALAGYPQPFVEGANITFNGIKTFIDGTPDPADTFTITPSQNQSVFTTIENAITALSIGDETARTNALNRVLTDMDQALDNFTDVRALIGARLNSTEVEYDINEAYLVFRKASRSKLEDLNFAQAASDLSRQTLSLEAAQQSFVKIQSLSLFNFIR